ncbi:hypothetical protein DVR12_14465 [Chitinophaga silvatica]|uniref:F5/8 type C domain-containing protein n=1 Tax=Chitinophaga silvatica TaxID=2282649 RepID=A0A3E1Y8X4_9BACT|nr:discoidin domain-containing protein [Chitinophaga silvatica]RFS21855.1 hypothetical protein DVR12_14465 [Chitinophaga silvatica]
MKISVFALALVMLGLFSGCIKENSENKLQSIQTNTLKANLLADPVTTWQEHWFEHQQLLNRVFFDTSVAVYFDNDVNSSITWPNSYLAQVWNYTKNTYGAFGTESRLYAIFHSGKYSGGHPSTYMDASHDYRNVIDVGSSDPNAWISGTGNDIDLTTHEVGHIVEGASKGVHNSPAFSIWHDSKWMEIYQYDVYIGLGRSSDVTRWYNMKITQTDSYPRAGTYWFRDWFYPIYSNYGGKVALNQFFNLLAQYFPKSNWNNGVTTYPQYTRDMNFGEFVHFWSGAAGADLKQLALNAFGNKDEQGNDWTAQLIQAKSTFSGITYPSNDITNQGTLTVSKENNSGASSTEGSSKLIDNNYSTKFFVNSVTTVSLQLLFSTAQTVKSYTLTSGNDAIDRDPKNWELRGSNDGNTWTTLNTQTNQTFSARNQTRQFTISNSTAYKYYGIFVSATNGSPDFQLSEWRLFK